MTLALLHADPGPAGRGSREPTRRRRRPSPHLVPAIITAASVWAAAVVVTWAVPQASTPGNAARAFVEARMDQDWEAVWELLCSSAPFPDRESFVAHMWATDELAPLLPPAAAVVIRDVVRETDGTRPTFTVTIDVTALDWNGAVGTAPSHLGTSTTQVPVVLEAGKFRVCFGRG